MTRAADLAKLIAGGGSITVSDNSENLKLITTDADASVGPTLRMDRQSASAADGDLLGKVNFVGHNDAGTPEDIGYAGITAIISDASDGTEDGKLAINTMVAGTERSRIFVDAGETVFNEDSIDVNFRVETDNSVFGLFVDAGNDHVCINTGTDHGGVLNIETTGNGDTVTLACTDTDNSTGPVLVLKRAVTGTDDDLLGRIRFDGRDSAGNNTTYARLDTQIKGAANGSESAEFTIKHLKGGSEITAISCADDQVTINEDSANLDFRVESDGNSTMFHVDGGNNSIGVNTLGVSGAMFTLQGPAGSSGSTISTKAMHIIEGGFNTGNTFQVSDASSVSRFAVDGDGNVLVGKSSSDGTSAGVELIPNGASTFIRSGNPTCAFNRLSSDGEIMRFQKDSATVGSIRSGPFSISASGVNNTGWSFGDNSAIEPMKNSATADNLVDLGSSSKRMDDIHATNGTIQTSDENEKQDIASMTTAELAVGKRLSTLFKTFRWKDKVIEKADKARTHSGIVAQEVKAAFEAEGLDATKYALFCSDTWTNDDGKEQTRMGVRYPELLSFIASYNESRFTAIEARLAKLEGA